MFNSDIIDLAITLCFVYFLLALMCTTINEIINSIKGVRSKYLEEALQTLFFDKENWDKIYVELMNSPFIQSLQLDKNSIPSYIPSKNFAQAMVDVIHSNKSIPLTNATILSSLDDKSIIQGKAKKIIITLLTEAGDDYDKFLKGLEDFFDNAMDRVNGWFKRNNNKILLVICFVVTIMLNVDTIYISTNLWEDKNSLKRAADLSVELSKGYNNNAISLKNISDTSSDIYKRNIAAIDSMKVIQGKISSLQIPIGWNLSKLPDCNNSDFVWQWLIKLLGWSITAFALYLGAPFWFDALNKIVNLRATGNKPAKSSDKPDQKGG
jgi:hypothetical protein